MYGQIAEFNRVFSSLPSPKYSPTECIKKKLDYCSGSIPIMIGSDIWKKLHKKDNPLEIYGYFIVNGIAKVINNIRSYIDLPFNQYTLTIVDNEGNKYQYKSYDNFTSKSGDPYFSDEFKEYIMNNIEDVDKNRVIKFLDQYKYGIEIGIIDCYKFYYFIKYIINKHVSNDYNNIPWRIITPARIIKYYNLKTLEYMKINNWRGRVYISNDLFHYNRYYDEQSVRRVVYSSTASKDIRMIGKYDKNKICPVSSPSDLKCGLVNYLCEDVYLDTKVYTLDIPHYIDGKYSEYSDNVTFHYEPVKGFIIASSRPGWLKEGKRYTSMMNFNEYYLHNPPTRINFAMKMLKQAIGPHRPINDYFPSKWNNNKDILLPVNVAIMAYKGYNVEDAVVVSRRFCNIFRTTTLYTVSDFGQVINLNVKVGDKVKGKVCSIYQSDKVQCKKNLILPIDSIIKDIIIEDNYITITSYRESDLVVGDKVASVHGQKGVISLIEDVYTDNNELIDLIINPHAFPSRSTMGQIIEMGNKYVKINGNNILFGKCKYMALKQQVYEKVNYQVESKKNPFTLQYYKGKKSNGGITFGEMERNCAYINNCLKLINDYWTEDRVEVKHCPDCGLFVANINAGNHPHKLSTKMMNYSSLVIISYLRCAGKVILYKKGEYKITTRIRDELTAVDNFDFGFNDPLEVSIYKGLNLPFLPNVLRDEEITKFYNYCVCSGVDIKVWKEKHRKYLAGKKGLFHTSQEGKRINNFIRSVITPDPTLKIDEIRVPKYIKDDNGILCRQPSLSKYSLRCVKLLKGNELTIQISPLIVGLFNGDFDGDEMNVFFIQNVETIKECRKNMQPIKVLVQDYLLKNPETFTADHNGIRGMIEAGSKGNETTYNQIYKSIGNVYYNRKIIANIKENYFNGVREENWYILCIASREAVASIAINTPFCGDTFNKFTRTTI